MFDLNDLPDVAIMGILNVTPDSFSDGGQFDVRDRAITRAQAMIAEGASIIDIGGESTRPGAAAVSVDQELERVVSVIEGLRELSDIPVSIDTSKPEVMRAAIGAGASMVNDVRALRERGALQTAADLDCPICLMHMQGEPRTMQHAPDYADVVEDVKVFLKERVAACEMSGIVREKILLDPGYGFGKTHDHNLELLRRQRELLDTGCRLLAGFSRKSTLGAVTGREVDDRMPASIVAATIAIQNGASVVRVHDVAETRDALRVLHAVRDGVQQ